MTTHTDSADELARALEALLRVHMSPKLNDEGPSYRAAIAAREALTAYRTRPASGAAGEAAMAPESARDGLKRGELVEAVTRAILFADCGSSED